MQHIPEDRGLEEDFDGESEESGWYFDLPQGAWERQQEKSRELREGVRSNADHDFGLDQPNPERAGRKGLLGFNRKSEEDDSGSTRLIAGGKWMLNRDPEALKELRPQGETGSDTDGAWTPPTTPPLALRRSSDWQPHEKPAPASEPAPGTRLRWEDAFAGSDNGDDPLAPMRDWPKRQEPTGEPSSASDDARAERPAPQPLPLRRRSHDADDDLPPRTSRWDEVFSGSVGEGSIVEAMRNWASGNMDTGDSARDEAPREIPPEFLKPFDWELEPGNQSAASEATGALPQSGPGASDSDPAPAPSEPAGSVTSAYTDWVEAPGSPDDDPSGGSWDQLAPIPTFEGDPQNSPRKKKRGFFARLFGRKDEDEPQPAPLPDFGPAEGDWVPVEHVPAPEPVAASGDDEPAFVPRWANPALAAEQARRPDDQTPRAEAISEPAEAAPLDAEAQAPTEPSTGLESGLAAPQEPVEPTGAAFDAPAAAHPRAGDPAAPEPVTPEPASGETDEYTSDVTAIINLFQQSEPTLATEPAPTVEEREPPPLPGVPAATLDTSEPMPSNDNVDDANRGDRGEEPEAASAPEPNLLQFPVQQPPPEPAREQAPPNVVELRTALEEDDDPWAAFIAARRARGEAFPKGNVPADEGPAGRDAQFSRENPEQPAAPVDEPAHEAEPGPTDPASAWAQVFSQLDAQAPQPDASPSETTGVENEAEAPLASEETTDDDPWAAVAEASGYTRGPGDLAVYRGSDEETETASEDELEPAASTSAEAPGSAPLWEPEQPDEDDVVLRAFYEHANTEEPEPEPEPAPPDDEVFAPLLGRNAGELIDEASGDDEPQSFLRPQAPAPRPVPTFEDDWVGADSDESDDWDSGGSDGGYPATSFYQPYQPEEPAVEPAGTGSAAKTRMLVREIVETALLALLVFLCVRASFQNFRVSGESMYPTLEDGQFVIVNKLIYSEIDTEKLSRFLPFIDPGDDPKKHVFHGPERGDIIVLQDPRPDHNEDLIKRVIALPGERIAIQNGQVYINGYLLIEPYITEPWNDNMPEIQLGKDEYFVMGDNRRNSLDSRSGTVGLIHEDLIIGKAMFSYWPTSHFGFAPNASPKLQKPELTTQRIGD